MLSISSCISDMTTVDTENLASECKFIKQDCLEPILSFQAEIFSQDAGSKVGQAS